MKTLRHRVSTTAVSLALALSVLTPRSARADDGSPPPEAQGQSDQTAPSTIPAGFEVQLRTGYMVPFGGMTGEPGDNLSNSVNGVVPLWADVGYRIGHPNLFLGAYASYGGVLMNTSNPSTTTVSNAGTTIQLETCGSSGISCSGNQIMFGVEAQMHLTPEASFDWWLGAGSGLEFLYAYASTGSTTTSQMWGGFDYLILQAGGDYHGSAMFGVGPSVMLGFGQYQNFVLTQSSGQASASASLSIPNQGIHEWLTLGVRGTFDSSEVPAQEP
jgi:hypothetical protein